MQNKDRSSGLQVHPSHQFKTGQRKRTFSKFSFFLSLPKNKIKKKKIRAKRTRKTGDFFFAGGGGEKPLSHFEKGILEAFKNAGSWDSSLFNGFYFVYGRIFTYCFIKFANFFTAKLGLRIKTTNYKLLKRIRPLDLPAFSLLRSLVYFLLLLTLYFIYLLLSIQVYTRFSLPESNVHENG